MRVQPAQPKKVAHKQVTLKSVPADLWLAVKVRAMRNGETVPEFVIRAVRTLLSEEAA